MIPTILATPVTSRSCIYVDLSCVTSGWPGWTSGLYGLGAAADAYPAQVFGK